MLEGENLSTIAFDIKNQIFLRLYAIVFVLQTIKCDFGIDIKNKVQIMKEVMAEYHGRINIIIIFLMLLLFSYYLHKSQHLWFQY